MKSRYCRIVKNEDICTGNNRQVFMVRFVHSTHSQFHPSVAGKWLVWGDFDDASCGGWLSLFFSVFSHDALDACCNCIICTFNRVPKEGEYLYNRYLPVISMVWVAFLILLVYVGPLLHEQEEVAGCSIGKTERRLYEKDCFASPRRECME